MENISLDLDLEANADHPHCAGWIQIFQAWAELHLFGKVGLAIPGSMVATFDDFAAAVSVFPFWQSVEKRAE